VVEGLFLLLLVQAQAVLAVAAMVETQLMARLAMVLSILVLAVVEGKEAVELNPAATVEKVL
jgi:hypothetical protein